jgi:hypothetical protein
MGPTKLARKQFRSETHLFFQNDFAQTRSIYPKIPFKSIISGGEP